MFPWTCFLGHSNSRPPCLLVVLLSCIAVCSSQDFTRHPRNATVEQGVTLTLECVIPDLAGQAVFWKKGGGVLFPLSIYPTYSTDGDASAGDYSLTIQNVSLAEDNYWSCQVSGVESSTAYVTVIEPVKENDALSVNQQKDDFNVTLTKGVITSNNSDPEGERLVLFADVSNVNPPAEIAWFNKSTVAPISDSYVQSPSPVRSGDPSGKLWNTTSTLNMTVEPNHDDAVIICQVTHISLGSPIQINVVLDVKYLKSQENHVQDHSMDLLISRDVAVSVKKVSMGNPQPAITLVGEGFPNLTGDSLVITSPSTRHQQYTFSCLAKNELGEVSCGTVTVTFTVWKLGLLAAVLSALFVAIVGYCIWKCCCRKKGQACIEDGKDESNGGNASSNYAKEERTSPVNNTSKSDVVFMIREGQSHQPSKIKLDPIVYDNQNPTEKKRKKKKKRKKLNEVHASDEDGQPAED